MVQRTTHQHPTTTNQLPTSAFLRGGEVTDAGRESLKDLLYGLDTLEGHVAGGRVTEARMMRSYVDRLYRNCCQEFRKQAPLKPAAVRTPARNSTPNNT